MTSISLSCSGSAKLPSGDFSIFGEVSRVGGENWSMPSRARASRYSRSAVSREAESLIRCCSIGSSLRFGFEGEICVRFRGLLRIEHVFSGLS